MKNRITKIFSKKEKKLVTFVTGGDPNYEISIEILKSLSENGSDLIEIGMPFSDPMADGPTIQLSSNRAISEGIDIEKIFSLSKKFREFNDDTPLILMGYYNIIFHYGINKFVESCIKSKIDGLIIVDLQPEEDDELLKRMSSTNIDLIRLITPTTDEKRLKTILKNASGFLYYVTIMGITGQHSANIYELEKSISFIKKYTKLPIVCGFGINDSSQIRDICEFSDGVVVGSSIIKIIEKNFINNKDKILPEISKFVKNLKKGTE